MRAPHKLDSAQAARVPQFANEEELAGIDGGFHHHLIPARGAGSDHDLAALVDTRSGGNGTGNVLACFDCGDALAGVQMDGRVDVYGIHVGIADQFLKTAVARADTELLSDLVQLFTSSLADSLHPRFGMALVNRNELLAEPQANNRYVQFRLRHRMLLRSGSNSRLSIRSPRRCRDPEKEQEEPATRTPAVNRADQIDLYRRSS
jgi:hypothetical protein